MSSFRFRQSGIGLVVFLAGLVVFLALLLGTANRSLAATAKVTIPGQDRFTPFALTIHVNDSVQWINNDLEDHTVTSDDFFTTAGNKGTDHIIPGTDNSGGKPGTFTLKFTKTGGFIYYCHFHSKLDSFHQPVAPGPFGGIPGTPMTGVITVVP